MLSFFRRMAKSKIFLGTVGVMLLLSLAIFGDVRSAFTNIAHRDAVVSVADREVSRLQFRRQFDNRLRELGQQAQRTVTIAEAVQAGLLEQAMTIMSLRQSLYEALERAGIRPSDKVLAQQLSRTPEFQNPITGQFDRKTYIDTLTRNGLIDAEFEDAQRDQIRYDHFQYAVAGGLKPPMLMGAIQAIAQGQTRTFSLFGLNPASVPMPKPPTDAQLEAFIKENAERLKSPERRSLTVVRFSARAVEGQTSVDPALVQRTYDFRKDTLSEPERRTVVQIPVGDAGAAQDAAARLTKGEDPAAVARALKVEPITHNQAPRTAISDPAVAQAAFTLASGAVSAPIKTALGYSVVKVLAVTPGKTMTFEQARPTIEAELRTRASRDRIYDVVEKFQDAHGGGASLKEAASAAGVTPLDLPPVTAQGADERGQPQPMLSQKLLEAAFKLPEGGESEVEKEADGEYYAVRVVKIFAPALPKVAEQRQPLTALYMRQEHNKAVAARLQGVVDRINKGESMDAAAASIGARIERQTVDIRTASGDRQRLPLYRAVFNAKPGEVVTVGPFVVKLESVNAGPAQQAALIAAGAEQQVQMGLFSEINDSAARWAGRALKAKTNKALAREALNLPPEEDEAKPK